MEAASPQNRWRMSNLSTEYSQCYLALGQLVFLLDFAADSVLPLFAGYITASNFDLYYIIIYFSTTWFAFPSAEYHMYPSLHLSAASLYLPVCSWDADENGTWNVFGVALLSGISIHGHSRTF